MGFHNLITHAVDTVRNDLGLTPTVCELGNQTLKNAKQRRTIYKRMGLKGVEPASVREWYLSMGFSDYVAIDVNQERDSIAMDLNLDLQEHYGYTNTFDLVTNNGTGEHVFDQLNVFRNTHNLCKQGGAMIHCLPCFRWLDHGFYNFNPNLFTALATANHYRVSHLWLAQNNMDQLAELDPGVLHRVETMRGDLFLDTWERDVSIVAISWKTKSDQFRLPIQELYGGDNIDSQEIASRYNG
jgi:SAM-dependent methyltransferase